MLLEKLDRYRMRLGTAQVAYEKANNDEARARASKRLDVYTRQIEEVEAELAEARAESGGGRSVFRHRLEDLSREVDDHEATEALVAAAKEKITEEAEAHAPVDASGVVRRPIEAVGTPYAGPARCMSCHPTQHAQWAGTAHAKAYQGLVAVERHMDQGCYACHVTGAFHDEGPKHPARVPKVLEGVSCEACHGPADGHVKAPAAVKMQAAVPLETCLACHDGEQDEGRFDRATYWPKVLH